MSHHFLRFLLLLKTLSIEFFPMLFFLFLFLHEFYKTFIQMSPFNLVKLFLFFWKNSSTWKILIVWLFVIVKQRLFAMILLHLAHLKFRLIMILLFLYVLTLIFQSIFIVFVIFIHKLRKFHWVQSLLIIKIQNLLLVALLIFKKFLIMFVD